MIQEEKDKLSMIGFFVFNLILVYFATRVTESSNVCSDVMNAASALLVMTSTALGATAVCIFTGCTNHKVTLGLLSVISMVSLILSSYIHHNCKESRKYSVWVIVFNVLLLASFGGLAFYGGYKKGYIKLPQSSTSSVSQFNYPRNNF
jgi:hypothetical protein|tara:strand:- start:3954 stop:4397 length:444 start_codon:yes stop_codon:yes gene_type:complete